MKTVLAVILLVGCATASPLPYEPIDGLLPLVAQIKGILSTNYGFNQLKTYLLSLDGQEPVIQEVHHVIQSNSEQDLKDAVNGFFANVPILAIEPGFDYPTLATLIGEVKTIILTEEGIKVLRNYLDNLHATQPLLQTWLKELKVLDNALLKVVVSKLLSNVESVYMLAAPSDTETELTRIVALLKGRARTSAGLKVIRDHLNGLQTTNPNLILAKTVLSAMSDKTLIELVTEIGKNIPDVTVEEGTQGADLIALIGTAKNLLVTADGVVFLRTYFKNLQTEHFLVARVQALLDGVSDQVLVERIEQGYTEIFGYLLAAPADITSELRITLSFIKNIITTKYGVKIIRDQLDNLETTNPTLILAKTVLSSMSDDVIIDLATELFKNIPRIIIEPGFGNPPKLLELIAKAKDLVVTDEGIKYVRNYFDNLETGNFLIVQLKGLLKSTSDEKFKATVINGYEEIFGYSSGAAPADVTSELRYTLSSIKPLVTSKYGVKIIRDHLNNLETTNPTLILAKTVLASMNDNVIIDLVKEVVKNLPDIEVEEGFDYPGLLELIAKAKDLVVTDEGILFVRNYFDNLETENFLIVRLKGLLKSTSDEKFKATVINGYEEIFGYSFGGYMYSGENLRALLAQIKHVLKSKKGLSDLIDYMINLKSENPLVTFAMSHFSELSQAEVKVFIDDFLFNIPAIQIEPGFEYPGFKQLMARFKKIVLTPEGLQDFRDYAASLVPAHPEVQVWQTALQIVDDNTLFEVLKDILHDV